MKKSFMIGAGTAALTLSFITAGTTLAASNQDGQVGAMFQKIQNRFRDHQPPKLTDEQISNLAAKLNLDSNQIKQELASGKQLPEVLKSHNITREQVESILGKPKHEGNRQRPAMDPSSPFFQATAQVLGISADELKSNIDNKKDIRVLAESKGLSREQFHTKINEILKQMIKDGKITDQQQINRIMNHPKPQDVQVPTNN